MLSVGVDIGTYSIKVADIEPTSKSYVIRRVQEFPLSLDLTRDRKIEIIDTLRTLFAQYDLNQTHFIFGVPQKHISARVLNFPFRERFKVQKAVVPELEDELPFSQEDAVFDVKIIRYLGPSSEVIAMAVPKEPLREVVDTAHDCGVQPHLISAESLALNNLFERWDLPPPEKAQVTEEIPVQRQAEILLHIGHTSTQVLILVDGALAAVRQIDWGAKNVADAIGQKYGLNYLQGMQELRTKGFILLDKTQATREQATFSGTIETSLQNLVTDLRMKMIEVQSELNLQWTKGHFSGGGAHLKNLGAFLTQQFQIPFNRFKQFENQATAFDANPHLETVSTVAVGLAIEGLKRPRNPATNFLKGEFARQSHFFENLWEKWGYTAQVVTAAFFILLVYSVLRESLTSTLLDKSDEALHTQAEAVAGIKKASPERIRKFISQQEKLEKARKQSEKVVRINSALDVFDAITNALPTRERINLEIKRFAVDADMAEVQGYTGSNSEKEDVQKALQRLSLSGQAESVPLRIPVPAGKVGFAYRLKVQRFSGG